MRLLGCNGFLELYMPIYHFLSPLWNKDPQEAFEVSLELIVVVNVTSEDIHLYFIFILLLYFIVPPLEMFFLRSEMSLLCLVMQVH